MEREKFIPFGPGLMEAEFIRVMLDRLNTLCLCNHLEKVVTDSTTVCI